MKIAIICSLFLLALSMQCSNAFVGAASEDEEIGSNVSDPADLYNEGTSLYYQGKYKEAIYVYDNLTKLDPGNVDAWYNEGLALESIGEYDSAIAAFDETINLNPKYIKAYYGKGLIFMHMNRYYDSIKQFDKAIDINPNFENAWYNKGLAYYYLGDYEESLRMYNKFIDTSSKDPNKALAWNNIGIILSGMGEYEDAINAYQKSIELDPNLFWAWCNRGVALSGLGKHQEAIESYDKAIGLNPHFEAAWNNKGVALSNLGDYDGAIEAFNKAIEINPNFESAWNNKGAILSQQRKYNESVEAYNRAISINPKKAVTWYNKGLSLFVLRNYTESVDAFNEALKLNPKDKKIWFGKSNALQGLNRPLEAAMATSMARGLDLDFRPKIGLFIAFLGLYVFFIILALRYHNNEKYNIIISICLINLLGFLAFSWILCGLFDFFALFLFLALCIVVLVIIGSIYALLGLPDNAWLERLSIKLAASLQDRRSLDKSISILSILAAICYLLAPTIFYFRYEMHSEESMLFYLRIFFLIIFFVGLVVTLPVAISLLSSVDLDKDTRNMLLIIQFAYISINSIYLSLILWVFGFGIELLSISPILLGIMIFSFLFAFLLPYLSGWEREKRWRDSILKKQLFWTENIKNVLVVPTSRLYVPKLQRINREINSERSNFERKSDRIDDIQKNRNDLNKLSISAPDPMQSDPKSVYLYFLKSLQWEIQEIIELFEASGEDSKTIENAKIYSELYMSRKGEILDLINANRNSKPILWIGLTFILTPFLATIIGYISNEIGPKLIQSIIMKLIPELMQFSSPLK
jgi:tetratricopeptide (TPR) repeat protein